MTDVIELIVAEHRRIDRLFADLDHAASHPPRLHLDPAGPVWARLAELVLLHADAEEEICFPPMFALAEHGSEQLTEALAGLDEIRATVAEGIRFRPGSPRWQAAVRAAGRAAHKHSATIEPDVLPALCRGASLRERAQLARKWAGFAAAWRAVDTLTPAPGQNGRAPAGTGRCRSPARRRPRG
jgi:hypothetical protein